MVGSYGKELVKFSPVALLNMKELLLIVATNLILILYKFDAKFLFLNGEFREEVYVSQPEDL